MSNELQKKLTDGLEKAANIVIQERAEYYKLNKAPEKHEIDSIIKTYSYKNAAITAGASLIPGPWGMAAAVPEIILVIQNQIKMAYDIGKAHGHNEKVLQQQLLIEIVLSASGNATLTTATIVGQKIILRRAGARAVQNIITILGGKVTQQLVKSMAAKWIPLAGAAAMATWTKYSTEKVGETAKSFLVNHIEISEDVALEEQTGVDIAKEVNTDYEKIKILTNLMKIDSECDDTEISKIKLLIDNSNIDDGKKYELIKGLDTMSKYTDIDYSVFDGKNDEILYLIIDMIALAKIDNRFDISEKLFIKQIAKQLNFPNNDLEELLAD